MAIVGFEYELCLLMGSKLGLQLIVLFWKALEFLGGGDYLEEVDF